MAGFYPRALRFVDSLLDTAIIGPFGRTGGAWFLLVLCLVFAVVVLRANAAADVRQ